MADKHLSRFTPSVMPREALEEIFVQEERKRLAEELVAAVRDSVLTPAKHYSLVLGPRGIGKTHLVSVVYHRVRAMEDLRDRLRVAWLHEEEWGVTSFLDLLLRIFRTLIDEEGAEGADSTRRRLEEIYDLAADDAERVVSSLLKETVAGGTLLLVAENADELFKGLGDTGRKSWRSYIQENPFWTILATSPSLFSGVEDRDEPFFGFFTIHNLEELSVDEATELLRRVAGLKQDHELAAFLQTPAGRARVRAVGHLAGWNHRIYITLSGLISRESLDELVSAVMNMLDELTPFYQSRMSLLTGQQRKIVEFLCDRQGAVPVKEIAQRCFLSPQVVSSQLSKLKETGYVTSTSEGRESYYEVREPLMRLCLEVKKSRGRPIALLVDFLRLWYSKDELRRKSLSYPEATVERDYFARAHELAESLQDDPLLEACLRDLHRHLAKGDFASAYRVAEELTAIRGKASDWASKATASLALGQRNDALEALNEAIRLEPDSIKVWFLRGIALHSLGRREEALASFEKAIEIEADDVWDWSDRGVILDLLGRRAEALASFEQAIAFGEPSSLLLFNRANALIGVGRWDEGFAELESAFRRAAELGVRETSNTPAILRNVMAAPMAAAWHDRVAALVDLYERNDALVALGAGLVRTISDLNSPLVSDAAARSWLEAWKSAAATREGLQIPLRLLDAAVRYRESGDRRVLLELPAEQRALVAEVLGVSV